MLQWPCSSLPERVKNAVLKQSHRGQTKGRDRSRPAQPKSSNTQLDECLICQQLRRTGVDQGLAVTCKVRACLHTSCRYRHSAPWQGAILSSRHPRIVYIRCNGFTEGCAPHLICLTVKCVAPAPAVCSEPSLKWLVLPEITSVAPRPSDKNHVWGTV